MRIFFSVGEPSGDLHGANLISELCRRKPGVELTGFGGPRMAAAGCQLLQDMTELAVMGLGPVLAKLPKFFALKAQADRYFRQHKPDAVVLIDYPGFNWHIAALAKTHSIPVFYYGIPQLWAWMSWRVYKVRKYVDHALCKLPFEEAWLRERGCNATYVGHPYFDELQTRQLDRPFLTQQTSDKTRLVTILPGSRGQEVRSNLPALLKAAVTTHAQVPGVRFAIASYNQSQAEYARRQVARLNLPLEVHVGRTPELIEAATVCLACSGSVSLELLYHTKPAVMVYRISPLLYWIVKSQARVKYMTLVNLLTTKDLYPKDLRTYDPQLPGNEDVLYPEFPTCTDQSAAIARHAIELLTDEPKRLGIIQKLAELKSRMAGGGASATAADYLLKHISPRMRLSAQYFDLRSENTATWRVGRKSA